MFDSEIPYQIEENRFEYVQHIQLFNCYLIMIFNFYTEKYGLYCIHENYFIEKIDADEIVKNFKYLPIEIAKNICNFPLSSESYGF
jgi:hypothetical protein